MIRPLHRILLIALLSQCFLFAQSGKPHVKLYDYLAPPSKIDNCVREAHIIAVASVLRSTQRAVGRGRDADPVLDHEMRIDDLIKGNGALKPGGTVTVSQYGGVVVSEGVETEVDDREFPILHAGERFIVFLDEMPGQTVYVSKWGAGGMWKIDGQGNVHIPEAASHVDVLANKNTIKLDDITAILKSKAGAK